LESGFVTTIRNESMDSRNESTFLRISYTNPASLQNIVHIVSLPFRLQVDNYVGMKVNIVLYKKLL
jgi:hypothetical protein